jgi:SOS response regulatory protein OraA/RecX
LRETTGLSDKRLTDLQTTLGINKEIIKNLIEAQSSSEPIEQMKKAMAALNRENTTLM